LAVASSTNKRYGTAWRSWQKFKNLPEIRAKPDDYSEVLWCLWAADRFRHGIQATTVKGYITGISTIAQTLGHPVDVKPMFLLQRLIRGFKRVQPRRTKHPKRPITVAILRKLMPFVNFGDRMHGVYWAMIVLAVYGLLRLGEIARASAGKGTYPMASDFSIHDGRLTFDLQASKTDPFRQGILVHYAANGSDTCPIAAMHGTSKHWAMTGGSVAFATSSGMPVHKSLVTSFCDSLLGKAGFDPRHFSGHSFRRGGAQSLYDAGIPMADIKVMGRWRSDAFALYFRLTVEKHQQYSEVMSKTEASEDIVFGRGFLS
jgi:integrase